MPVSTMATEELEAETLTSSSSPSLPLHRLRRNLHLLSFSFMLLFSSYGGMANLQSSINREDGVGSASNAATYGTLFVTALFVPKLAVDVLGLKWTLVASMGPYIVNVLAQFYPSYW